MLLLLIYKACGDEVFRLTITLFYIVGYREGASLGTRIDEDAPPSPYGELRPESTYYSTCRFELVTGLAAFDRD